MEQLRKTVCVPRPGKPSRTMENLDGRWHITRCYVVIYNDKERGRDARREFSRAMKRHKFNHTDLVACTDSHFVSHLVATVIGATADIETAFFEKGAYREFVAHVEFERHALPRSGTGTGDLKQKPTKRKPSKRVSPDCSPDCVRALGAYVDYATPVAPLAGNGDKKPVKRIQDDTLFDAVLSNADVYGM